MILDMENKEVTEVVAAFVRFVDGFMICRCLKIRQEAYCEDLLVW
jgi:hypothetical protein